MIHKLAHIIYIYDIKYMITSRYIRTFECVHILPPAVDLQADLERESILEPPSTATPDAADTDTPRRAACEAPREGG